MPTVMKEQTSTKCDNPATNEKDTGYRGIWYMNQPSKDAYVYKYSGGLGTYCSSHSPFAVHPVLFTPW